MSEENVQLVRALWGPFEGINVAQLDFGADGLREVFEPRFAPDVELRTLASGFGSGVGEHYRGWEGLVSYLSEWMEPFSEYQVENLDYIAVGDFVLVPSRQSGVGSGSGARVEIELTTLHEVRDARIAFMQQFDTLEEARAAARDSKS